MTSEEKKSLREGDKVRCTTNTGSYSIGSIYIVSGKLNRYILTTIDDRGSTTNGLGHKYFDRVQIDKQIGGKLC